MINIKKLSKVVYPMTPFLLIGALLVVAIYFLDLREDYQDYEPGKAVPPGITKHYRLTDPDYRENERRDDVVDLEEKMAEYKFDGLDGWPRNDMTGWFADAQSNRNNPGIYRNAVRIWPD